RVEQRAAIAYRAVKCADDGYVVDGTGRRISLPRGSSDAALAPYHVERSKLFVLERTAAVEELDGARIARAIGFTRFPYSLSTHGEKIDEEGSLLRAADLIGQLSDPHYLRKAHALYHEFEEIGLICYLLGHRSALITRHCLAGIRFGRDHDNLGGRRN